ncbi:BadF/BadG/BcrA/BcrD ATPase family protein [Roseibium sp. SCP14]|uniref:BadF/BadG/BcrA/BcrD ATPase family protein n=1 Tax=Roseibium sp. SCP14 TaxID=3141375 RepID=UPI00333704D1
MTYQLQMIAIDGGGTRCRVACMIGGQKHIVEAGSANVSTDLESGVAEIVTGLGELARELDIPAAAFESVPAYIGLAGASWPEIVAKVAARLPLKHVRVEDDRPSAVRGALGRDDGILVHCGTGSFQAMQRAGRIVLTGGWGPVLGDEASAQWVGRKALSAVLMVQDGVRPVSALTERLSEKLGGPAGIVAFAGDASPADFGNLAKGVTEAAAENDPTAVEVMRSGAAHIATHVRALGWSEGLPLLLTGGIAAHYAPYLDVQMQQALAQPKGQPIDGALSLAREFAEELSECSV